MGAEERRQCFTAATDGFVELVGRIRPTQWERPALGDWDVRALVGHSSRALSTIETYLGQPGGEPAVSSPVGYFIAVLGSPTDGETRSRQHQAISERGRQTGAELGHDPTTAVRDLARRVLTLVDATPDNSLVATPAGSMTLVNYLPTRTFELTVHGLDLARVLGQSPPLTMSPAISASCELAGRLAARHQDAAEFLLMLTGRSGLPTAASIL